MIFEYTARFKRDYRDLPEGIRRKFDKVLALLQANPRHPSLRLEKVDYARDVWSGRIDRGWRFTFQWVPGGLLLRRAAAHDAAYRAP